MFFPKKKCVMAKTMIAMARLTSLTQDVSVPKDRNGLVVP
jgi:hypothetical protein